MKYSFHFVLLFGRAIWDTLLAKTIVRFCQHVHFSVIVSIVNSINFFELSTDNCPNRGKLKCESLFDG